MSKIIINLALELIALLASMVLAFIWFGVKGLIVVFIIQWTINLAVKNRRYYDK